MCLTMLLMHEIRQHAGHIHINRDRVDHFADLMVSPGAEGFGYHATRAAARAQCDDVRMICWSENVKVRLWHHMTLLTRNLSVMQTSLRLLPPSVTPVTPQTASKHGRHGYDGQYRGVSQASCRGVRRLTRRSFFNNPKYSDITVHFGAYDVPAHKIVLAKSSDYFRVSFDSDFKVRQSLECHRPELVADNFA